MTAWFRGHPKAVGAVIVITFVIGLISLPFVGGGGGHHEAQRLKVVTGPPKPQPAPKPTTTTSPTLGGTCGNPETPATLTVDLPEGAEVDNVASGQAADGSSFMVCDSAYTISPVK